MQYEFVPGHHYGAYKIYEELYGFDNANIMIQIERSV